jgi:hypothetical protein
VTNCGTAKAIASTVYASKKVAAPTITRIIISLREIGSRSMRATSVSIRP